MTPEDKEEKFWTDELVDEYVHQRIDKPYNSLTIEQFKQSKMQKIPEGIISMKDKSGYIMILYPLLFTRYQTYSKTVGALLEEDCKIWSVKNGADVLNVGDKAHSDVLGDFTIEEFRIDGDVINIWGDSKISIGEKRPLISLPEKWLIRIAEEKPIKEQLREKLMKWLKELE